MFADVGAAIDANVSPVADRAGLDEIADEVDAAVGEAGEDAAGMETADHGLGTANGVGVHALGIERVHPDIGDDVSGIGDVIPATDATVGAMDLVVGMAAMEIRAAHPHRPDAAAVAGAESHAHFPEHDRVGSAVGNLADLAGDVHRPHAEDVVQVLGHGTGSEALGFLDEWGGGKKLKPVHGIVAAGPVPSTAGRCTTPPSRYHSGRA